MFPFAVVDQAFVARAGTAAAAADVDPTLLGGVAIGRRMLRTS